jgi:hypothetical protein
VFEQRQPDAFFDLLDLAAKRRLRHVQASGRARDVHFFGYRNEIAELSQLHADLKQLKIQRDCRYVRISPKHGRRRLQWKMPGTRVSQARRPLLWHGQ